MHEIIFIFLYVFVMKVDTRCSQFNYKDYYNWWGPRELKNQTNTTIVKFNITFNDEMIENLRCQLKNHGPLTPSFNNSGFNYGTNVNYLKNLSNYWAVEYPFEEREARLNQYDHYWTYIQGLKIHFMRYKTNANRSNTTVLPLLMLHGWPGSILEFYYTIKEIETLCLDKDFDFDIITPSLPGYGYSDAAVIPGLGVNEISVVMRNLMLRLGFNKYYVQGGDWGAVVASIMAVLFCDEVQGYHTNFPLAFTLTSLAKYIYGIYNQDSVVNSSVADRMYPAATILAHYLQGTGYLHIQASQPDTIGIALSSSPIALLGWFIQMFSSENPNNIDLEDGGVENNLSRDDLLDNTMIYWSTNKITSSLRLYSETINKKSLGTGLQAATVIVPTWGIQAKHELVYMTEAMLRSRFVNLVNVTVLDEGTHFLAWELPKIFAQSVVDAITKFREISESANVCS